MVTWSTFSNQHVLIVRDLKGVVLVEGVPALQEALLDGCITWSSALY